MTDNLIRITTVFKAYRMREKDKAVLFANYEDAIAHARMDIIGDRLDFTIEETYHGSLPHCRTWYIEDPKGDCDVIWAIHEEPLF